MTQQPVVLTIEQALQQAISLHLAGQLHDASNLYHAILQVDPHHPDTNHNLGLLTLQLEQPETSLAFFQTALQTNPQQEQYWFSYLATLIQTGQPDAAYQVLIQRQQMNLAINPDHVETLITLGNLLYEQGDCAAAKHAWLTSLHASQNHKRFNSLHIDLLFMALADPQAFTREEQLSLLQMPRTIPRLQVEVTTACNLQCQECLRTIHMKQKKWISRHMQVTHFHHLLTNLPTSPLLVLQGFGEPTLHPHLTELIAYTKTSGRYATINFNTNALVHDIDYYRNLHAAGLNSLSVSIDSLHATTAQQCRAGTDVTLLEERLWELRQLFPNLAVSIVVSHANIAELPTTLDRLSQHGQTLLIELQSVMNHHDDQTDLMATDQDITLLNALLTNRKHRWPLLHIYLSDAITRPGHRCIRPFIAPFITVDGWLTPCCTIHDPTLLGHTNLLEIPFWAAMRQPAVVSWYEDYFQTEPTFCQGCCMNPTQSTMKTFQ